MHARTEWTSAGAPGGSWSTPARGVPDVFVHHEGGPNRGVPSDKPRTLREIESYVLGIGYIAIDYNVMVFQDGDVWAGREVFHEDAATANNNDTSVSICAVGNFEREPASDALIAGIHRAIEEIVGSGYSTALPNIRPHRDVYATACPGANLVARMADIRNWGSGSVPAPLPPEYGGEVVQFIQVKGGAAIAVTNGIHKQVFDNPDQLATQQWITAASGQSYVGVQFVSQDFWDSLPTVTGT